MLNRPIYRHLRGGPVPRSMCKRLAAFCRLQKLCAGVWAAASGPDANGLYLGLRRLGTKSSQTLRWREMDSNFQYAGAVKRAVTPARFETGRRALFADHFIGYPTEGYAFGDRGGRVAPPAADPSQATGRVKRRENQFTAPAY
jgi:hypothetical protein